MFRGRAARLIECDCYAHLVSKASSVIGSKSQSPAFRWSSIYYTEPQFTDKIRKKICRWYNCTIMKSKISFAIMTAVWVASQWTTALCSKCCSIWKHVKNTTFNNIFTPNSLHNVSRMFEINPSVRWCGLQNKARNIFHSILSSDKGIALLYTLL